MSIHNEAKQGEIAEHVLMAGDPLRAKYIAENYLENVKCYNKVRNMFGYTGLYKGAKVSVQGSGMGVPSISIYVHELINEYHAKNIIRIGTCGSFQKDVDLMDVILAMGASTDSAINKITFGGMDFAALADFSLLKKAQEITQAKNIKHHVGNILTSDVFYVDEAPVDYYKKFIEHKILAVEMETTALYTLAAKFGVNALSILTVTDNLITDEHATAQQRQLSLDNMIKIALETV
ncbi:MAG: purine-nucleoside phosphorylase [Bacteroidota bacterium]|nr:purine-nucleoside phosphorylase [Bacteroidota bacterium]